MDDNLLHGIELVKAGDRRQAQAYLSRIVQSHPDSEEGWLWLGYALDDLEKRKYCYQRVLAINPANPQAWKALDGLYNARPDDYPSTPVQAEDHSVEMRPNSREIAEQRPAMIVDEANVEGRPRSALPPLFFGFFLALILLAVPGFFLIRYGLFDGYFLSYGMVALPSMPPVYQRVVEQVLTPAPILIPAEPLSQRMAQAEPLINQAKDLISQNDFYSALPILNQAITIVPDIDEPYYLRAFCTFFLLYNQRSLDEHVLNLHAAVFDLDRAITIRPEIGNYHALRGLLYFDWAGMQELTINRNYLYGIALQNFLAAQALNADLLTTPEVSVIGTQIQMGECEKGLEEIDSAFGNSNLGLQGTSDLYLNQAIAYACLGKLDEALEAINSSMQYGEVTGEQKTLEAAILYQKGEPDEALKILDGLIVQSPNYGGDRYLLRALIVFEQGDWDETYRSMLAGGGNVWLHGGLYSYVQGKMGLQLAGAENRTKSIDALQYAEASMPVTYNVLKARIQTEIVELGGQPWDLTASFTFQPTTVAEIHPRLTPRPTSTPLLTETLSTAARSGQDVTGTPVAQGAVYFPKESNIVIVDLQTGTGPVTLSAGQQEIFRFQPSSALSFAKVMDVVAHLDAEKTGITPPLLFEVWNPHSRTWTSIEPGWTDTDVLYPGDYVLPEGDMYISVRNLGSAPFQLNNLSITMVIETSDRNLMQFGTK